MSRVLLSALALWCWGCETPSEDLPGQLAQVTIEVVADTCVPARAVGDAGVQYLGVRPDGGFLFTMADQAKLGPQRDGTALVGVSREQLPTPNDGQAQFGEGSECAALIGGWKPFDGGFELTQDWPGFNRCSAGPGYLPTAACGAVRRFTFTPIGECSLRCVRFHDAEVSCECP